MNVKEVIKENFSRCASNYDEYSAVQRRVGGKLIGHCDRNDFKRILEIGCGTGNYTQLLSNRFGSASIKAVDISEAMIATADKKLSDGRVELVTADAENMRVGDSFDLVTSNACFQWFEDIDAALEKYSGVLVSGGVILFSVFGPSTFRELREVLKGYFGEDIEISSNGFLCGERLG